MFGDVLFKAVLLSLLISLSSCGGGGGSGSSGPVSYTVSGSVVGLTGSGLIVQINSVDDLSISENGSFSFITQLQNNASYTVDILTQPVSPEQICVVSNASGSITGSNVSNVSIICHVPYSIGGSVSGLNGTGLVLQNNTGDDISVITSGDFVFTNKIENTGAYNVSVLTQPASPAEFCTVQNASGAVADADISNVQVVCEPAYSVSGTVTGLNGSGLVLQNNNTDNLNATIDGGFVFANALANNASYSVSVLSQPTNLSQLCTVSNASGSISNSDVTSVTVSCVTIDFSIGGSVSGLNLTSSGLTLQNNGGDDLSIAANGQYTFPSTQADGSAYSVSVLSQPVSPNQICSVTNGASSLSGANVTTVTVDCVNDNNSVNVSVRGLHGGGLVLQNNAADDLLINNDGTHSFLTPLSSGQTYTVSVLTQPNTPTQTCTAIDSTGLINSASATEVIINCSAPTTVISGDSYGSLTEPSYQRYAAGEMMIWSESDGNSSNVMYRFKPDSQSSWTDSQPLPVLNSSYKYASNGDVVMLVEEASGTQFVYKTFNGAWSSEQIIVAPANVTDMSGSVLDANSTGFALAVVSQLSNAKGINLFTYSGSQWTASPSLTDIPATFVRNLRLLYNDAAALVSWSDSLTSNIDLYTSLYNGSVWSATHQLHEAGNTNKLASFKLVESSNSFASVWVQPTGAQSLPVDVYVSVADPATFSWSAVTKINNLPLPQKAFDITSNGSGFAVVWNEDLGTGSPDFKHTIFSRIYSTDWSAAQQISTTYPLSYNPNHLQVISNNTGYAVGWQYSAGEAVGQTTFATHGVIHDGNSWLSASVLGESRGFANAKPVLKMASDGQTYAASWSDFPLTSTSIADFNVSVSSSVDNTWPATATILKSDVDSLRNPLVVTSDGYEALWFEHDGNGKAYYSKRYTGSVWDSLASVYLAPKAQGRSLYPNIARNSTGVLVAAWIQYDSGDWRYFMNTNNGSGWGTASYITGCTDRLTFSSMSVKVISNNTDFMIFCNSLTSSGFAQSLIAAIPFDGTTLGTLASVGQSFAGFETASNGSGYALAYQANGAASGFRGQHVYIYDNASQLWTNSIVYESSFSPTRPSISSNGTGYGISWSEQVTDTQNEVYVSTYNSSTTSWDTQSVATRTGSGLTGPVLSGYTNNGYALSWVDTDNYFSVYNNVSWSTPELTETATTTFTQSNSMAYSQGGLGVMWAVSDNRIFANVIENGIWQTEVQLTALGSNFVSNKMIVANNGQYAALWNEGREGSRDLYTSRYNNGAWEPSIKLNNNFKDRYDSYLFADGTGFRALWAEPDLTHAIDKTTLRIHLSDIY